MAKREDVKKALNSQLTYQTERNEKIELLSSAGINYSDNIVNNSKQDIVDYINFTQTIGYEPEQEIFNTFLSKYGIFANVLMNKYKKEHKSISSKIVRQTKYETPLPLSELADVHLASSMDNNTRNLITRIINDEDFQARLLAAGF